MPQFFVANTPASAFTLNALDWAVIVGFFVVITAIGVGMSRRAGKSLSDYFLSGRSLPWWLAGTSMVATTFAADTPLAVTGLVAKYGLAGNWFWWAFAMGGMFTVFVYARLWRRAEVVTDVELVEMRYRGKPAAALRGTRALYIAFVVNPIIIGWVTGAMIKILNATVLSGSTAAGHDWWVIIACLAVVAVYATLSGMWGVTLTDFIQFFLAMAGCIILAVLAVSKLGGIDAMRTKVIETSPLGEEAFAFLPSFSAADPWMPVHIFMIMLLVQWWATWYPGAEPGGGGYVVQRMASCKNEKQALLATLWYQIAHYCVRPWPWLIVAFAALALYPNLLAEDDPGVGFAWVIRDVSPHGVRGLLLVTFFAAFMSTLSTQMNWGASYLVRDIYQRFIKPDAGAPQLTRMSRLASLIVLIEGGVFAWLMRDLSVDEAWKILAALGAGTGAVFMLRWFWWRINAWSEIVAMVAALVYFLILQSINAQPTEADPDAVRMTTEVLMAAVAGLTIATWLAVTLLTPPESDATLDAFYRKVHPGGPGWKPVAARLPEVQPDRDLGRSLLAAVFASGLVYSTLPGVGAIIFGQWLTAAACLAAAVACGVAVWLLVRNPNRPSPPASE